MRWWAPPDIEHAFGACWRWARQWQGNAPVQTVTTGNMALPAPKQKACDSNRRLLKNKKLVGVKGFEPSTPCTPFNTLHILRSLTELYRSFFSLKINGLRNYSIQQLPSRYNEIQQETATERQPEIVISFDTRGQLWALLQTNKCKPL